jgi:hypothetical protein
LNYIALASLPAHSVDPAIADPLAEESAKSHTAPPAAVFSSVTFRTSKIEVLDRSYKREGRIVMPLITQSSNQIPTVFGSGYVLEQHLSDAFWTPAEPDEGEGVVASLTASMFGEILKSFRSALSLR